MKRQAEATLPFEHRVLVARLVELNSIAVHLNRGARLIQPRRYSWRPSAAPLYAEIDAMRDIDLPDVSSPTITSANCESRLNDSSSGLLGGTIIACGAPA
ncbi:hypothetical protein MES4922_230008 [Mesorhizobium ventifaucium]|uniref:Uncharacterized protein n=1 Tax=Mesorhizobium ventifaucium TaxID=666020 RepID=A0ABN8JPD6_9HYPH|nr:hypothetical protein MES4922_230008 [Mesorhizobium ventifaucium]